MNICLCGSDEFVAMIPSVMININILGLDDSDNESDYEFSWRHEYYEEDYASVKCKNCDRISRVHVEDLGMQESEEDMDASYTANFN